MRPTGDGISRVGIDGRGVGGWGCWRNTRAARSGQDSRRDCRCGGASRCPRASSHVRKKFPVTQFSGSLLSNWPTYARRLPKALKNQIIALVFRPRDDWDGLRTSYSTKTDITGGMATLTESRRSRVEAKGTESSLE